MHHLCPETSCTGCTACASACPRGAIVMTPDEQGFLHPQTDEQRCTDCGLCRRVCPVAGARGFNEDRVPEYFALRCLDDAELERSQSGGAFFVLSEWVLKGGGVVYGATFGNGFRCVEHRRAAGGAARDAMRGSKYVESDLRGVFGRIRRDLEEGRTVLFSGTPCQVAGLRALAGKKGERGLITADVLCHGVASPRFWQEYVTMIERKKGATMGAVRMRDKSFGWLSSCETYVLGDKRLHKNTFYSLYYGGYISRPSCYHCPFASRHRTGDLSMGDFHGWNERHHVYSDNRGMSLVMVNSMKGKALLDEVRAGSSVFCEKEDPAGVHNVALEAPASMGAGYDQFWQDFYRHGALCVCKKWGDMSWRVQMHIKLSRLMKALRKHLLADDGKQRE